MKDYGKYVFNSFIRWIVYTIGIRQANFDTNKMNRLVLTMIEMLHQIKQYN